MSALQFSIQSMMSSILGMPSDADIIQYSNYGSTGGDTGGPNGIRSQFSDTVLPAATINNDEYLTHVQYLFSGENSIVLRPISAEDQATQNLFGLSFLPWNQRPYDRYNWGSTGHIGSETAYPFNPWNQQTMMSNGVTVAKVAGIGIIVFFAGKLILRETTK
jgi:hypothetical protein